MPASFPQPKVDPPGRDHALALQRFVGGLQIFGGTTLAVAYLLGATALALDAAATLLVALGVGQIACGALWVTQPRRLRGWVLRRPGTLVACGLLAATAVIALGGSGAGRSYITSAQCWLILVGLALPGRRWIAALAVVACAVVPVWVFVDGNTGGFDDDGALGTAILALAASVAAGLWMGRVSGTAAATLNRWHLVEVHELGVVSRLRQALVDVRNRADGLALALQGRGEELSPELRLLRERLAQEVDLGESTVQHTTPLDTLVERIRLELGPDGPQLEVALAPSAERVALRAVVADAVLSVIRRQIDNVVRHAPDATTIWVRAEQQRGVLVLQVEDDGGGGLPVRAGVGSAWSSRQLARVGGTARYFAGEHGVGLEVQVAATALPSESDLGPRSVRGELERFGLGILDAVRLAGYVGDSLTATSISDTFGVAWLIMPLGAIAIEVVIRASRAGIGGLTPARGALLASGLSALVAATFAWAPGGPDSVVPATTSVLVPALVLFTSPRREWGIAEGLRLLAVAPLLTADLAANAGLLLVYPFGIYLLVRTILRFTQRASDLEERVADALGRASLASAVVRGLSLQHDAIDVLARNPADEPTHAAADELEVALGRLDRAARSSLNPQEIVNAGLAAALGGALDDGGASDRAEVPAGAVDRITLFELAALAADERASCTPPGILGRRRLTRVEPQWHTSGGSSLVLSLVAQPSLGPPDVDRLAQLTAVAETLGIGVRSTPDALTLSYARP